MAILDVGAFAMSQMLRGSMIDVSEALSFMEMKQDDPPFLGSWGERHWMNTPGTFYRASDDNCGTGPLIAPNNIAADAEGYDVVFRQPTHLYELRQIIEVADAEPFQGYGVDGNTHWTLSLIREWWRGRARLEEELSSRYTAQEKVEGHKNYHEFTMLSRWLDYYRNDMYNYLRHYAFFIEQGRTPNPTNSLPTI